MTTLVSYCPWPIVGSRRSAIVCIASSLSRPPKKNFPGCRQKMVKKKEKKKKKKKRKKKKKKNNPKKKNKGEKENRANKKKKEKEK